MRPCQLHEQQLQLYLCVLTQEETLCRLQGGERRPFTRRLPIRDASFLNKKPLQADGRYLDDDSTPKRKEMDKLEFEQWPYVTRFKK